ncbi:TPA: hypothetical protein N0F65_008038, partial [Lagenidium giganteum]
STDETDHSVFVLHHCSSTRELSVNAQHLVAVLQHIVTFGHLQAEHAMLQVDAARLLLTLVHDLESLPRGPCFVTVVQQMMVLGLDVEQHDTNESSGTATCTAPQETSTPSTSTAAVASAITGLVARDDTSPKHHESSCSRAFRRSLSE